MANKEDAARACKDPNPIIDGRKANVNLAYIGAKPRLMQSECTKFQKLTLLIVNQILCFEFLSLNIG